MVKNKKFKPVVLESPSQLNAQPGPRWVRGEAAPLSLQGVSTHTPRSHSQLGLQGVGPKEPGCLGWEAKPGWTCSWEGLRSYPTPVPETPKSSQQCQAPSLPLGAQSYGWRPWVDRVQGQGGVSSHLLCGPCRTILGIKPET